MLPVCLPALGARLRRLSTVGKRFGKVSSFRSLRGKPWLRHRVSVLCVAQKIWDKGRSCGMKRFTAILLGLTLCLWAAVPATAQTADSYKVGNTVTFGHYEQDNNLDNGKEPVDWIVLEVKDGQALLISQYCLDARAYNTDFVRMTWSKCTLRAWLNSTFMQEAFSAEEQAKIVPVTIVNSKNPHYGTPGGEDTTDSIFLLSLAEAYQYFPDKIGRVGMPTAYAVAQGAYVNETNGRTWWWLRTPGVRPIDACGVRADGRISGYGSRDVNRPSGAIRPVLWVTIGE